MNQKMVVKLQFPAELRTQWPTRVLTAEAQGAGGPWSVRAELWDRPDNDGSAFAFLTFLSAEAPIALLAGQTAFELTLGRTKVATCQLLVLPGMTKVDSPDNDFLEHPEHGLRAA